MKNVKNTKTILFASLIAAMILPFSGMNSAVAEESTIISESVVDATMLPYLQSLIDDEDGKIKKSQGDFEAKTVVKALKDEGHYKVKTVLRESGEAITKINYELIQNPENGDIRMITDNQDVTFQNVISTNIIYPGASLTSVVLESDTVYVTSSGTAILDDHDGACHGADYDISAYVYGSTEKANVYWNVDNYYWYYCVVPQFLQIGVIELNDHTTTVSAGQTTGSDTNISVDIPDSYTVSAVFNYS